LKRPIATFSSSAGVLNAPQHASFPPLLATT